MEHATQCVYRSYTSLIAAHTIAASLSILTHQEWGDRWRLSRAGARTTIRLLWRSTRHILLSGQLVGLPPAVSDVCGEELGKYTKVNSFVLFRIVLGAHGSLGTLGPRTPTRIANLSFAVAVPSSRSVPQWIAIDAVSFTCCRR